MTAAVAGLGLATAAQTAPAARPASHCAGANTSARRKPANVIRAATVCEINAERATFGLPPMRENTKLDRAAQQWAETMVATRDFSHGSGPGGRVQAAGFRFSAVGEVIGSGFGTPKQVVAGWIASDDHCRLLLDPTFSSAGIGVIGRAVPGAAIGGATWVGDFALPARKRAPSHDFGPAHGCPYAR
jgi:uncharacterized protein YkwD